MPRPIVYVRATFVSVKAGNQPLISIDSPDDVSAHLGEIRSKEYEKLKSRFTNVVEYPDHKLFFHKDSVHKYRLDELVLQNGAVYGLKERRVGDSSSASKITAGKLVAIKSADEFEKHLDEVAAVEYKRRGKRQAKAVESYTVELFIVIIKEKLYSKQNKIRLG